MMCSGHIKMDGSRPEANKPRESRRGFLRKMRKRFELRPPQDPGRLGLGYECYTRRAFLTRDAR
jgi:hypothetical protein